jgi:hypothetical protein
MNASTIKKDRKMIRTQSRKPILQSPGNLTSQSGETRNLSRRDQKGFSRLLDHVNDPPASGRSIRPYSKIKSEISIMVAFRRTSLNLSAGKRMILKLPPIHRGNSHKEERPANSS